MLDYRTVPLNGELFFESLALHIIRSCYWHPQVVLLLQYEHAHQKNTHAYEKFQKYVPCGHVDWFCWENLQEAIVF